MSMFGFGDGFDAAVVHRNELERIAREAAQCVMYGRPTDEILTHEDLNDDDLDYISRRISEMVM